MKTVRTVSIAMAVVLLVVVVAPFAVTPAAAQKNARLTLASPAQTFVEAASGLPLLAPMNVSFPVITMSVADSSSGSYSCTLIRQSPDDWAKMRSRQSFDAVWVVQNSGNAVWPASATQFAYVGGTKMQTAGDEINLSNDVGRGKKVKLSVDMIAPKAQGTYSTLWALFAGNTRFCKVTLTLTVTR